MLEAGYAAPELATKAQKLAELIVRDVVATVMRTQSSTPDFEWSILNNYDLDIE